MFERRSTSQTKRNPVLLFWIVLLLFVSFFSGFIIAVRLTIGDGGRSYIVANSLRDVGYFDERLYAEVWSTLKNTFVDKSKLDDKQMFYGALKGMVAAIDDPYTNFFDPEESKDLNEELNGSFEGIGAEIGIKDKQLIIVAPLPGSPAEQAGLRAGDQIVRIDTRDAAGLSLDEAVALIRGKAGTKVTMTIYRAGESSQREITVIRRKITIPAVQYEVIDGIASIRLFKFSSEAEKEFAAALRALSDQQIRGLIVDVRNNPGGFLDQAVSIASAWIPKGTVVVREVYHDDRSAVEYPAVSQFKAPSVPTVILVNEGSASASEILAGALQDYGKATLVGATTYGKGSVQDLKRLSDGSELKVTISQWLTPKGRIIDGTGIEPDVVVQMTAEDYDNDRDPQFDKAKELINNP